MRNFDAVVCDHCQTDLGFTLTYPRYVTVRFEKNGTDEDGIASYKVIETKGNYKQGIDPMSVSCNNCRKSIRFWIATRNKYVKSFFTDDFIAKL